MKEEVAKLLDYNWTGPKDHPHLGADKRAEKPAEKRIGELIEEPIEEPLEESIEESSIDESVELAFSDLLFDPQTSGGLLIALPENEAEKLLARLKDEIPVASIVGRMKSRQEFSLEVI